MEESAAASCGEDQGGSEATGSGGRNVRKRQLGPNRPWIAATYASKVDTSSVAQARRYGASARVLSDEPKGRIAGALAPKGRLIQPPGGGGPSLPRSGASVGAAEPMVSATLQPASTQRAERFVTHPERSAGHPRSSRSLTLAPM